MEEIFQMSCEEYINTFAADFTADGMVAHACETDLDSFGMSGFMFEYCPFACGYCFPNGQYDFYDFFFSNDMDQYYWYDDKEEPCVICPMVVNECDTQCKTCEIIDSTCESCGETICHEYYDDDVVVCTDGHIQQWIATSE